MVPRCAGIFTVTSLAERNGTAGLKSGMAEMKNDEFWQMQNVHPHRPVSVLVYPYSDRRKYEQDHRHC
jgi:hypothetical protein